ncbi:hypothetical protein C8R45DRAFT_923058 [Mycena sanguinolenta]|nr:hypothetical protein C8R45DRAFT_923058 [Mycena sanguinolenta]
MEPPVATRWLPRHAVLVAPQMTRTTPKMSHRTFPGQPPDDVALPNEGGATRYRMPREPPGGYWWLHHINYPLCVVEEVKELACHHCQSQSGLQMLRGNWKMLKGNSRWHYKMKPETIQVAWVMRTFPQSGKTMEKVERRRQRGLEGGMILNG